MANINYSDRALVLKGGVSENVYNPTLDGGVDTTLRKSLVMMAQSSYFTAQLSGISDTAFKTDKFGMYLPVESISTNLENIESMVIPVGIFGDLTLPHRKKIGRINLTINDKSDDRFEIALRKWYNLSTGNKGGKDSNSMYIGYLSDIVKTLTLKSYSPTGVLNETLTYEVMLVDAISIERSYSENALKKIKFSLAVVGRAS